jgi:Protein of unknown function (DUF4012)
MTDEPPKHASEDASSQVRGRSRIVRRTVAVLVLLLVVITALTVYVVLPVLFALSDARRILTSDPTKLTAIALRGAQDDLESAQERLEGLPSSLLRAVPLVRQNLDALRSVVDGSIPVIGTAAELRGALLRLSDGSLVEDGQVDLELLSRLEPTLRQQASALEDLERGVREHTSGWLIPPLWDQMYSLGNRISSLRASAQRAEQLVPLAQEMLGSTGTRRYLVVFQNNAELRGSGGLPSGLGTVTATEGRIELGRFEHYQQFADPPPYRATQAPSDFRRYNRYDANTTRYATLTMSPDGPDVAAVAGSLFRMSTGQSVDGVLFVDARGMAALMPQGASVTTRAGRSLSAQQIPPFLYSGAYASASSVGARRDQTVEIGKAVFRRVIGGGLATVSALGRAASSVAGGHIKMVSLRPDEERTLDELGVSGEMQTSAADVAFVAVQNFGGDKLDFWAKRKVRHGCDITSTQAECETRTTLTNIAPKGLPRFVYQREPYALMRSFVETYVPRDASVTGATLDGRPARVVQGNEDATTSVGVFVKVPRTKSTTVTVSYRLPLQGRYSLSVLPQPLSRDAQLDLDLSWPRDWTVEEAVAASGNRLELATTLGDPFTITAAPPPRTGLSSAWDSLVRFWTQPVF